MPIIFNFYPVTEEEVDRDKIVKDAALYFSEVLFTDFKQIAWCCWGMNVLFKDFNYKQMFDYIGSIDKDDFDTLKEFIEPLGTSKENNKELYQEYKLKEKGEFLGILKMILPLRPVKPLEEKGEGAVCNFSVLFEPSEESEQNSKELKLPTKLNIYNFVNKEYQNYVYYGIEEKVSRKKLIDSENEDVLMVNEKITQELNFIELYLGPALPIEVLPLNSIKPEDKISMLLEYLDLIYFFDKNKLFN